ncbi:staphylococcal-like nuclease CAN1 [Bidens hawaiensis]|uniref:staphylococcal-like nuclease CAN1 n=1 Tax=Bidens hawaiensis TaxID=980011 RepID=UPI00404B75C1
MFVSETLRKSYKYGVEISELEGFLEYYGLPPFCTMQLEPIDEALILKELEARHKFLLVLHTSPVTRDQVADGGCLTVYVEVQEYFYLPSDLLFLMIAYRKAWANRDDSRARELLNEINASEDYKFMCIDGLDILTKKYEIRLRGVVVPGIETSRGIEARDELVKMVNGKCLKIEVSHLDDSNRCVGDVYCNGICLQDKLLAKGLAMPDQDLAEGFLEYYGLPPFCTMQLEPLDEALILKEELEARHKFLLVLQTRSVGMFCDRTKTFQLPYMSGAKGARIEGPAIAGDSSSTPQLAKPFS